MDITIVATIKLNGHESKLGIKITEADAEVIARRTNQFGLALSRDILKLAFEQGIDIANSNLKKMKEDLSRAKQGGANEELIDSIENSIKLIEGMGEN